MSKWFEFNQNNSGGSFDVDDMVCHRVFIEAENAQEANRIAVDIGIYFDGCDTGMDCDCCGDRWCEARESTAITFPCKYSDNIIFQTVEDYAQYLADNHGWTTPDARIYYADAQTVKEIQRTVKGRG